MTSRAGDGGPAPSYREGMTAQNTATASSASHRIAVIPGDGIGPEVVAQSQKVLAAVCAPAEIELQETSFPLGAEHWLATGRPCRMRRSSSCAAMTPSSSALWARLLATSGSRRGSSSARCC